jgi:hypothetical protein
MNNSSSSASIALNSIAFKNVEKEMSKAHRALGTALEQWDHVPENKQSFEMRDELLAAFKAVEVITGKLADLYW